MSDNKNKQQNDIITLIQELVVGLVKVGIAIAKVIYGFIEKSLSDEVKLEKLSLDLLSVKGTTDNQEAIGVDIKTQNDLLLSEIDFKRHSFIVGASGFGKTNLLSILQEHSLKENKPIIFFDPKGDIEALTTFKEIAQKYNRPCYIFSEHYKDSISLNPIIDGTINQVVDRIMCSFEWTEPFYRDASRRSLVKALKKLEERDEPFTLKAVLDELIQMETPENVGLIAKIESIIVSDFGKILNAKADGLTLAKIRESNACLYIGLSTQGYGETAMAVGKLFLGELLYNSYKSLITQKEAGQGLNNPISVHFDEFGSLVTVQFIELLNKCRGAGIEITVAVQTASDIDRINPDLTKQIIENSANLFVLKQRLDDSASLFSSAIGTVVSKKETFMVEDGEQKAKGSIREVNELIVHPDMIKNLRIGQCVFLRQGPARVNLINIRNREVNEKKEEKEVKKKTVTIEAFN